MFSSKTSILLSSVLSILILCACTQKAVIVTANSEQLNDMDGCFGLLGASVETGGPLIKRLCSSDINKIISFANLDPDKEKRLLELMCGPDASTEKFKAFFNGLQPNQRKRLIRSFETFGYRINDYGC